MVDHLIAVSQGGASTWGNTVAACFALVPAPAANQRKAGRAPHEAGMKLLIEPKASRTSYLVASGDVPVVWKVWFEL